MILQCCLVRPAPWSGRFLARQFRTEDDWFCIDHRHRLKEHSMSSRDARIDAYIEKSAEFAKLILNHIRDLVHSACPQVEETVKWGFPHFMYKGMLCSMASFKQHCAVGF